MSWKFNPFTGTLDQVGDGGSGGSFDQSLNTTDEVSFGKISSNGEVASYSGGFRFPDDSVQYSAFNGNSTNLFYDNGSGASTISLVDGYSPAGVTRTLIASSSYAPGLDGTYAETYTQTRTYTLPDNSGTLVTTSDLPIPRNTSLPVITSSLPGYVRATLTASSGDWANSVYNTYYQWQSSTDGVVWSDIAGANSDFLATDDSYINKRVRVRVITENLFTSQPAYSLATSPLAALTLHTSLQCFWDLSQFYTPAGGFLGASPDAAGGSGSYAGTPLISGGWNDNWAVSKPNFSSQTARFDGSGQHRLFGLNGPTVGNAWSVSVWYKKYSTTTNSEDGMPVVFWLNNIQSYLTDDGSQNALSFISVGGGQTSWYTPETSSLDNWSHCVVTSVDGLLSIYWNGALVFQDYGYNFGIVTGAWSGIAFGNKQTLPGAEIDAEFQKCSLYGRALYADEVESLYNNGTPLSYSEL